MQLQNIERIIVSGTSPERLLLINPQGVFQCQQSGIETIRKIKITNQVFFADKQVGLYVLKIDSKLSRASLRFEQGKVTQRLMVDGLEGLQLLFKIMGRYIIIFHLQECTASISKTGQGAFAQVFDVLTKWKTQIALKCFEKKSHLSDIKIKKAFYNEIQIMQQLNNPHIISYDYLFETQKAYYLKMEFLQSTLKQRIANKLRIKQQKQFMRHILIGLKQMKAKKIAHRDLKPENVMIRKTPQGEQCVIIDFGLATEVQKEQYIYNRCGTPGFLAPQIANLATKKTKITCAVDMFSLGCIFFKMITGHYLFGGKSAKQILENNRKNLYNHEYFNRLSASERKLMLRLIDINPRTRITPEQALKSPYFQLDIDDDDEIPEQECGLYQNVKKMTEHSNIRNMQDVNSFCSSRASINKSTYSQAWRMKDKEGLKDSCLTFEMGDNDIEQSLRETISKKSSRMSQKGATSSTLKKSQLRNSSRTPEKSRFSKAVGRDLSNIL